MSEHENKTDVNAPEVNGHYKAGIDALTRSLHIAFILLSCLIAFLIIWYFTFGGYYEVKPQENVIVERFGKIVEKHDAGYYWSFPYPVSKIIRIPISKQTLTLTSFWHKADVKAIKGEQPPQAAPTLSAGKDGYLLTGDANIIHTEWELVYSIVDPMKYYRKCLCPSEPLRMDETLVNPANHKLIGTRGPRTLIQALLENSVIKVTAAQQVDSALYKHSTDYAAEVRNLFEKNITEWDIGIKVDNLIPKSITAPLNTVAAFQEVIDAELQCATEKENAKAYAVTVEGETVSTASRILSDAKVYKIQIVADIEAEQIYFKKILEEYKKSPRSTLIALYTDTITGLLENMKDKYIIPKDGKNGSHEVRIMLNPEPKFQKKDKEKDK
ncbi:MAG: SPFH domain-containing protein [Victivallales bacterium]